MNILFIYPKMFHPHRGGIERVSELLAKEFAGRGHHVFFLHNICDATLMGYPYPAQIFFFPNPSTQALEENGTFYRHFLIDNHIDIVINQDPPVYHSLCCFSKDIKNIRTISVIHTNPLCIYDHLLALTMRSRNHTLVEKFKRIARILKVPKIKYDYWLKLKSCYRDSFAYTDMVCLLSSKFIPELTRIYPPKPDKIVAIGNPNTYPYQEGGHEYQKKKQILYVGRIEWYQKRVDRLICIWKRLYKEFPDWELVFVGDGPIKNTLEQKCKNMERVIFAGYQNPDAFYKDASILCLTSDFEGWGMVLTEAMTFGTIPVVYNSYAAASDIIEDGKNGILVPPFSVSRFANELKSLMMDRDKRERMSKACAQSVGRFSIQNIGDLWEDLFARLKESKY